MPQDEYDPQSNHYLLYWEKASQQPSVDPVEIDDIQETEAGLWVLFTYLDGESEGMSSGAPYCNILTEKEADRISKIGHHIWLLREEVKRLNKEVRETYKSEMSRLVEDDREIL